MRTKIALALFILFGLFNCSDEETTFDLKGKWIDTDSFGLQFIEFQSKNKGRFGTYSKNHEQFEDFTYRIFDNKIAIDFIGDDKGETIHDLSSIDNERIQISGLTVIPEPSTNTYQRYNIKHEKEDNTIVLGVNDIYFDFETGIRLQAHPTDESRCPKGVECVSAGYAVGRFNLVVDGNTEHTFDLATVDLSPVHRKDTLINALTYTLLDITPYPDLSKQYKVSEYKVIVSVE